MIYFTLRNGEKRYFYQDWLFRWLLLIKKLTFGWLVFTFCWLFVEFLSFQKIQKMAYVHIVYIYKESIKSQCLIQKSQSKVKKIKTKLCVRKNRKLFRRWNIFEALPKIFKVTHRKSSEQQRVYIYTLFYSFWTYAIF